MTITVPGFHFSSTLIHKSWSNLLSPQIFALCDLAILINMILQWLTSHNSHA